MPRPSLTPPPRSALTLTTILALMGACNAQQHEPGIEDLEPEVPASESSSTVTPTGGELEGGAGSDAGESTADGDETGAGTSTTTGGSSSSSSSTTSDASTGVLPSCGDGVLDEGEACDLGPLLNDNSGDCLFSCELPVCGDGHVWAGHEQCDEGPNNQDGFPGGCSTQCETGPTCGDGVVQGLEECDLGDKNGSGDAPGEFVACDVTCRYEASLIFLSSVPFSAAELLGAAGADKRCQELALAAKLPNATMFKAWLSEDWKNVLERFSEAKPGMPYALRNGLRVAKDRAALLATGPETAIAVTEKGETIYEARVWTGTLPDGTAWPGNLDCVNWTSDDPMWGAGVGYSGVSKANTDVWQAWKAGNHWTTFKIRSCYNSYHLYCVEQ